MYRYPLYRRLGRPQGLSGWVLKILPPPGFNPQTIQLVASRYTDYAILANGEGRKERKKHLITKNTTQENCVWCCITEQFPILLIVSLPCPIITY
jgi:hypothetical protein